MRHIINILKPQTRSGRIHLIVLSSYLLLSFLLLLSSCNPEERCDVPMGDATCQLELMNYPNLLGGAGYEYLVGGYQGLVVIRIGMEEFVTYERTCPHDEGRLEVSKDYGNTVLECPLCHSRFNAFADGTPLDGSHTACPLYHYSTHYSNGILYISNW